MDTSGACGRDSDCDDGEFCNGVERCVPGAVGADERGCLPPATPRCMTGQTCDESARTCVTDCSVTGDADDDGALAMTCGGDDCDDSDPRRAPGLVEACEVDDVDEDCDPTTFGTRDADSDGAVDGLCCNGTGVERTCGPDCDDSDPTVGPTNLERCGGGDEDCDGLTDEGLGGRTYYPDRDGDGYGDGSSTPRTACTQPSGFAALGGDCDDLDAAIHPGHTDVCDGRDNDCDGTVDDPGDRVYYRDADADRHGDPSNTVTRTDCTIPAGFIAVGGDCDDTRATVYLGAAEVCDGLDSDCSEGGGAAVDEDRDADGHGALGATCSGGPLPLDDCDDTEPNRYPSAPELCNGMDDDCDGAADETTGAACGPGQACVAGTCQAGRRIAVAASHVCVIRAGEVWCWGSNEFGELGDGTTTSRPTAARVPGLTGIVDLSARAASTCARDGAGAVYCWGRNVEGQVGVDMSVRFVATPTRVAGLPPSAEISVGSGWVCSRTAGGEVWCWGLNTSGQLGDGGSTTRFTPRVVSGVAGVVQVSSGGQHTCMRLDTGHVYCMGANSNGQLGDGTTVGRRVPTEVVGLADARFVSSGNDESCAIRPDRSVFCWGGGSATTRTVPGIDDATDLSHGNGTACIVRASGVVSCWGSNDYGMLANGTTTYSASPVAIPGVTGAASVDGGSFTWCAELLDGGVMCWGRSSAGELGDGLGYGPQPVIGITDAVSVSVGVRHTCVVRRDGTAACFGSNASGELGDGTTVGRTRPVAVVGLTSVMEIEAGLTGFTCARRRVGMSPTEIWCWGGNSSRQLGYTAPTGSTTPMLALAGVGLSSDADLSCGGGHSCVGGSTWDTACWGDNNYNQLGCAFGSCSPGANMNELRGYRFTSVAVAGVTSCGIRGGFVDCWGDVTGGLFGVPLGTEPYIPTPTRVPGVSGAIGLDGGGNMCAVLSSGGVRCWGGNTFGERGDGTTTFDYPPTTVAGVTDAAEVSVGFGHSCVRRTSGRVSCWGAPGTAVGAGTSTFPGTCACSATPLDVVGLTDAIDVAAGDTHTCAVRSGGTVVCWGDDRYGQLGTARVVRVPGLP